MAEFIRGGGALTLEPGTGRYKFSKDRWVSHASVWSEKNEKPEGGDSADWKNDGKSEGEKGGGWLERN